MSGKCLKSVGKTTVETPVKTTVETPVKTPDVIIQVFKENSSLTLAEVAHQIGESVRTVERATRKLKYVGHQKGGHWEVIENNGV